MIINDLKCVCHPGDVMLVALLIQGICSIQIAPLVKSSPSHSKVVTSRAKNSTNSLDWY